MSDLPAPRGREQAGGKDVPPAEDVPSFDIDRVPDEAASRSRDILRFCGSPASRIAHPTSHIPQLTSAATVSPVIRLNPQFSGLD